MKILLIEDDDITRELLAVKLSAARYVVDQAADGELGLELASLLPYDLVLLDLQLPKIDGLNVCRELRNRGNTTPILMLTAQDAQEDIVAGLDTGADDYVTKPFEMGQILARIRALLRRGATATDQAPSLRWGGLSLNPATADVTYQGKLIPLTPKEYSLLELFLRNPQRVFSRSTILDHLWRMDDYPTEGAVTNLVKDLRNRLKRSGVDATVIQTVYGLGYRLHQEKPETKAVLPAANGDKASLAPGPSPPGEEDSVQSSLAFITARFQRSLQQRLDVLESVIRALQAGGGTPSQRAQARQEAHRLAGGLGTFGYEAGSALARKLEHLLEGDSPLAEAAVTQLSQTLLALKQAITGQPGPMSSAAPPGLPALKYLATVNLDSDLLQSLRAVGSEYPWQIDSFTDADAILGQTPPPAIDVVLLGLNPDLPTAQKFLPLEALKRRWPDLPIAVISHRESLAERVQAVRYGADRYGVAPLPPAQLFNDLQELVVPPQGDDSRVMVVDDDAEVATTIADLLTPWGIQVTSLQDSDRFWDMLRQMDPDLLILDQDMPTFSGVDLCQVVRKDSHYGNLPILMMTDYPNKLSVQQAFELGCDDLINKPIIGPELVTRVLSRIERSQLRQRLGHLRQQGAIYWRGQGQVDPVTLTANARYFDQFLRQQWQQQQQQQNPISLILCTPDGFESFRNTYGRQAVDALMRQMASLLQATVNPNIDLVARYSDEAFGIILPSTHLDGAIKVANRIQQAMARQVKCPLEMTHSQPLSVSLGIGGTVPGADQLCDDLLKTADQALTTAQDRGGNTFCLYPM